MKNLFTYLLIILFSVKISAQKEKIPVLRPDKKIVVYKENATYTFTLNTKKLNGLKANTAYLKILTFVNEKKATLETFYNSEEVKLPDHDLTKTTIPQRTDLKSFNVTIKNDEIILVDEKLKQKIIFDIRGYYDVLTLKNIKTGEIFESGNQKEEYNVPLYIR